MGWTKEMRASDWAVGAWAAALVIGAVVVVTWPISPWAKWKWDDDKAADWVQAVGSIVAILAAAAGLVWQHIRQIAHARRLMLEDELRRYRALHSILITTANLCGSIKNTTTKATREDAEGFRESVMRSRRDLQIFSRAVSEARPLNHDRGVVGMSLLRVAVILDELDQVLVSAAADQGPVMGAAFTVHEEFDIGKAAISNYCDSVRFVISEITEEIEKT